MHTIYIKQYVLMLLSIFLLFSCENDGDTIYLSGLEGGDLVATESEVVLSQEVSNQVVLSLTWTKSALSVSDPNMFAPDDVLSTYIEVSTTEDFSSNIVESFETGTSKAYTGSELNTLAKNLQLAPDKAIPVYFRLRASVGNNIDAVYSNTAIVNITSYEIDMSVGFILDSKMEDTGVTLVSPSSDGIYTGFMGATSWYNFFLLEGDGKIWGNDGVTGTAFELSSEDDADKRWNCWFPGLGGCYYVEVNTNRSLWSALYIPSLTVNGDLSAEMTFDRPNVKWTYVFQSSGAASYTIRLNGTGKLYDHTTGTDDAAAIDKTVAFSQAGSVIELTDKAGDITVQVPAAGEYTLVVDLSDPAAWKCGIVSGSEEPEETPLYVYLPGVDDGISGSWTFDNFLTLYNEEELAYAGVVQVNSLWGYSLNTEKDNWDDKYTMEEGDAYTGTLVWQGENNLPAPEPDVYLIDVSLKALTYNLSKLESQVFVVGLHDVWEFDIPLNATGTPGVYSGEITINSASPWGFQIHLDNSWNHYFGGLNGQLSYKGSNITDDASVSPGTYTMTVDLINGTYSLGN